MHDAFTSIFIDNQHEKTVVLLHGTGGDENDLLPLVANLKSSYNFLGLRGNVVQQGMNRFFLRNTDGSFDQESIATECKKLTEFLKDHPSTTFVGYSNGANMIAALSLLYPESVTTAVLLHAKLPFPPKKVDLQGKRFLVSYGENDQMIPMDETKLLITTLEECGATVHVISHMGGHELHHEEIDTLTTFLTE